MKKKVTRRLNFSLVVVLFALALWGSFYITESAAIKDLVQSFGYGGITLIAFFGGLNIFVPVPAATFVPVFISSGLSLIGIVGALVVGTTVADLLAYAIGAYGRNTIDTSSFRLFKKLEKLGKKNMYIPLLLLFLWASFVPFPNEAILIPLGLLGFRLRSLLIPFIAGNIVHNSLIVFGLSNVVPFL